MAEIVYYPNQPLTHTELNKKEKYIFGDCVLRFHSILEEYSVSDSYDNQGNLVQTIREVRNISVNCDFINGGAVIKNFSGNLGVRGGKFTQMRATAPATYSVLVDYLPARGYTILGFSPVIPAGGSTDPNNLKRMNIFHIAPQLLPASAEQWDRFSTANFGRILTKYDHSVEVILSSTLNIHLDGKYVSIRGPQTFYLPYSGIYLNCKMALTYFYGILFGYPYIADGHFVATNNPNDPNYHLEKAEKLVDDIGTPTGLTLLDVIPYTYSSYFLVKPNVDVVASRYRDMCFAIYRVDNTNQVRIFIVGFNFDSSNNTFNAVKLYDPTDPTENTCYINTNDGLTAYTVVTSALKYPMVISAMENVSPVMLVSSLVDGNSDSTTKITIRGIPFTRVGWGNSPLVIDAGSGNIFTNVTSIKAPEKIPFPFYGFGLEGVNSTAQTPLKKIAAGYVYGIPEQLNTGVREIVSVDYNPDDPNPNALDLMGVAVSIDRVIYLLVHYKIGISIDQIRLYSYDVFNNVVDYSVLYEKLPTMPGESPTASQIKGAICIDSDQLTPFVVLHGRTLAANNHIMHWFYFSDSRHTSPGNMYLTKADAVQQDHLGNLPSSMVLTGVEPVAEGYFLKFNDEDSINTRYFAVLSHNMIIFSYYLLFYDTINVAEYSNFHVFPSGYIGYVTTDSPARYRIFKIWEFPRTWTSRRPQLKGLTPFIFEQYNIDKFKLTINDYMAGRPLRWITDGVNSGSIAAGETILIDTQYKPYSSLTGLEGRNPVVLSYEAYMIDEFEPVDRSMFLDIKHYIEHWHANMAGPYNYNYIIAIRNNSDFNCNYNIRWSLWELVSLP